MRIELVKRPQQSRLFSALSPFIALGLTLIAGAIMFTLFGKSPIDALYYYFIDPLRETWSLHELAIKATPLIMIAVGLSVCYQSNNWNIGAEGQLIMGAIAGSLVPILMPGFQNVVTLPLMLVLGVLGGALYAAIPALLKTRFNTNEILASLMLVYVAQLFVDWLARGVFRDPAGNNFPGSLRFPPAARVPEIDPAAGGAHWGFVLALFIAVAVWFMMSRTMKGFEVRVLGGSPTGRALRRVQCEPHGVLRLPAFRRACRPGGHYRSGWADRPAARGGVAWIRVHGDHRGLPRPPQSARYYRRRPDPRIDLSRG